MRVMYRENMSGFTKMDEINDSDNEGEGETQGQIVKAKRLELINSTIQAQKAENGEPMIVYQPQGGDAIIFRNDSIPHGEKLVVRIMGDLYKFSADHAHKVASFIFAIGLYKVSTDITPLLVEFVKFLNTIRPSFTTVANATKFALSATTVFTSVLFWMGHNKNSAVEYLLDNLNKKYNFGDVTIRDVINNSILVSEIPKNITLASVVNDLYTALACFSKVCTNTIPTLVCNTTNGVCSIVSKAFTNLQEMQSNIANIFENYLESNDYSEDDASTISNHLSENSTKSIITILSSKSEIIENVEVPIDEQPNIIEAIVQANNDVVAENVDFTNMEIVTNGDEGYEPLSQLSDDYAFEETTPVIKKGRLASEVDLKPREDIEKSDIEPTLGGKSRRKHKKINKKTHKKHKKTHKKNNKKSHKKQRRSRKH
jgi:hypothetical protein